MPEYAEQGRKLCLLGATDDQIADFFEVSKRTINNWKADFPEFLHSLKRGKLIADSIIAESLFHRAKGYTTTETITASFQGLITDTKEVVKHYAPDTTAAIFWLKNRQPEFWRDKQEIDLSGKVQIQPITGMRIITGPEAKQIESKSKAKGK